MNIFKRIYVFFDRLEDRIRGRLSHKPLLYAFIGSIGVVLIWRGIWEIADNMLMPGWVSLVLGMVISGMTGLFVSLFIGDKIIISGINHEKKVDEKTEDEIKEEKIAIVKIKKDLDDIKNSLLKNKND